MTTTERIITILFDKLYGSSIRTAISGSICKHRRDGDSTKEDIVINCLPVPNTQLQNVIANVNIHVPDVAVTVNGMSQKQPNILRLQALSEQAIGILSDNWDSTLNYDVQQENIIEDREAGDHYVNIRIEFFIENL